MFILVTNNRKSMSVHLQDHVQSGRHSPGIFILNPDMSIGSTADELALIWAASETDEYRDQLRFLSML